MSWGGEPDVDHGGYQTTHSYDANGNLTQTIEYTAIVFDPPSLTHRPVQSPLTTQDRITVFHYDALNRQTSVIRLGLSYSQLVDINTSRSTTMRARRRRAEPDVQHRRTCARARMRWAM